MTLPQTIKLRVAERALGGTRTDLVEAIGDAIRECGFTFDQLVDTLAHETRGQFSALRTSTYDMPDTTPQLRLFDLPQVIAVPTRDGVLFVNKDEATVADVKAWVADARRYHKVQLGRFERHAECLAALDGVEGVDDDTLWHKAVNVLRGADAVPEEEDV
jgi:hypothetical protein